EVFVFCLTRIVRSVWIFALVAAPALFAQTERGTIAGTVTDATGAVVPGAKVVVTNNATNTGFTTSTGDAGQYTVPNLNPGTYTIRIEKEGFRPSLTTGMAVDAGTNIREDVTLEVGNATQAVEVTAEALALQTDNAKSETVITDKLIRDLP